MQRKMQETARSIFSGQPFSGLVGAVLEDASESGAVIRLPIRKELCQQHGFVHGGVLSYLADNAITFAGGMSLQGDALTSEFKINYVKPATGELLIAKASAVSVSGKQAVCQCNIFCITGEEETLCAVAQGTVVRVAK